MTDDTPNEILEAAARAKAAKEGAAQADQRMRKKQLARLGLSVGIGSAAVAAAVLFANRSRSGK